MGYLREREIELDLLCRGLIARSRGWLGLGERSVRGLGR